LKSSLLQ